MRLTKDLRNSNTNPSEYKLSSHTCCDCYSSHQKDSLLHRDDFLLRGNVFTGNHPEILRKHRGERRPRQDASMQTLHSTRAHVKDPGGLKPWFKIELQNLHLHEYYCFNSQNLFILNILVTNTCFLI